MGSIHDYLERCDKLAVLGGTFDPIHRGHLAVADAVLHEFKPRRVLFVPGGQPPHKQGSPVTAGEYRYQMALAATCDNPGFDVSRMEINRPGPSFTVDTITTLSEICPPKVEIFFVIGADAMLEILSWKDYERLMKLCKFIVVSRPGYDAHHEFIKQIEKKYGAEIHTLRGPLLEISGTEIRERFMQGQSVSGLMPRAAEDYARRHGLYQTQGTQLSERRFEWAKSRLKERLSPRRYKHTLGVVLESEKLAEFYGADATKARWAGLLHDCAKEYGADKKRALSELWGISLDEIMRKHIDLTHSLIGAESAKRDFYVTDAEVLSAIRYHTTGHKNMSLLDKIVMLADYIEPYRDDYPPLEEMRRWAYTDINKALVIGLKSTGDDLKERGLAVHPWCKDAIKDMKKKEV